MNSLLLIAGGVLLFYLFGKALLKRILGYPFRFVKAVLKRPTLLIGLIAILGLLFLFGKCSGGGDGPRPPSGSGVPTMGKDGKRTPGDPVTHPAALPPIPGGAANGNSKFAPDLVRKMDTGERRYYSREFFHVLDEVEGGTAYLWEYRAGKKQMFGKLTPGDRFTADSGASCRSFEEILVVGGQPQQLSGFACRKKAGGWCKLREGSTLTCDLTPPRGLGSSFYGIRRSLGRLF